MVTPLRRHNQFPVDGRPIFAFGEGAADFMDEVRGRARELARSLGVDLTAVAASGVPASSVWVFSDTAHPLFGQEVPADVLAVEGDVRREDGVGLVRYDHGDGRGREWTHMDRMLASDIPRWMAEKREGAGRDPRLSPLHAAVGGGRPLFRDAATHFDLKGTVAQFGNIFSGAPAIAEVVDGIANAGMEPVAYCAQFVNHVGASTRSGVTMELQLHFYTLWLIACVDRVDLRHNAAAEHLGRRVMQLQRAIRRDPKSPNFEGLDTHLRHAADSTGVIFAPEYEKYIAEVDRAHAQTLKQNRLAKEEAEHEETSRGGRAKAKAKAKGGDG